MGNECRLPLSPLLFVKHLHTDGSCPYNPVPFLSSQPARTSVNTNLRPSPLYIYFPFPAHRVKSEFQISRCLFTIFLRLTAPSKYIGSQGENPNHCVLLYGFALTKRQAVTGPCRYTCEVGPHVRCHSLGNPRICWEETEGFGNGVLKGQG